MRTPLRLRLFAPLMFAVIACSPSHAATGDWGPKGLEISNWLERTGAIASDGAGGAFVVTMMGCCSLLDSVLVRHVLPTGALDPSWPTGGFLLYNGREMGSVQAIADGHGGLFVLMDLCGPKAPCWEQSTHRLVHVEGSGTITPGWPSDGLLLPVSALLSEPIDAESDGAGGLIVGWLGPADAWPADSVNVYAQRYGANGARWWPTLPGEEGMRVCTAPRRQFGIRVSRDGAGGAWLAWNDRRAYATGSGQDIYATRVRAGGTTAWTANGRRVVWSPGGASIGALAVMDSTAATLAYVEGSQAYLQRLDGVGNGLWGVPPPQLGAPRLSSPYWSLVPHRDGQASVMWRDTDAVLHWQRFADDGSLLWQDPTGPFDVFSCMMVADVDDGDLAMWRTSVDSVLASRVTFAGTPRAGWSAIGDIVDASDTTKVPVSIAADLVTGHAFVLWTTDPWNWNVRVQRFSLATAGVDPNAPAGEFAITALAPNPSRAAFTLRFRLPRAQSVRAEAFDIVGRRLVATESSVLPAGEHALELRLPPEAAPGVYRVRLVSGAHVLTRTAIRLR